MTVNIKDVLEEANESFAFFNTSKPIKNSERGQLGFKNIYYNILIIIKYLIFVLKNKPKIIHIPIAQNRTGFIRDSIFIVLGKLINAKIIIHTHGGSYDVFFLRSSKIMQRYIKYIFKSAQKILVLSNSLKKQIIRITGEKENLLVLYNCVNNNRTKEKQKNRKLNILYIGTISMAKGAFDLLDVANDLAKTRSDILNFTFAGEFIEKSYNLTHIKNSYDIKEIKRILFDTSIINYLGTVYDTDKENSFIQADILVLPSYSEGMPMVILEAMKYGLAIISTNVGAIPEILTNEINGIIIEPGDKNALKKGIERLVVDEHLRNRIIKANEEKFYQTFSREVFSENLLNIYIDLVIRG